MLNELAAYFNKAQGEGVYTKLMQVQVELKAPKSQYNKFGMYKYRSCEDIQEAVKPLEAKHKVALFLSDEPIMIGERYYVKAVATFIDLETGETVQNTGYAREEEIKKGMDGSQITGAASSYARKYALNGLFLIDDTKDADTDEYKAQQKAQENDDGNTACQQPQKATAPKAQEQHAYPYVLHDTKGCKVRRKAGYQYIQDIELGVLEQMLTNELYSEAHADIQKLLENTKNG